MKVGLLTYHDTTNFGAWLQTYALVQAMLDMGIDAEIIDYRCGEIVRRELPKPISSCHTPRQVASWLVLGRHQRRKRDVLRAELSEALPLSRCSYDSQNVRDANDSYDAFLVGSDMLWAPEINGGDATYLLDFVKGAHRRFAYSTSMGKQWPPEWESIVQEQLAGFDRIALRERDGVERVGRLVCRRPEWVCDPTMLLPTSRWAQLASQSRYATHPTIRPGYALVYFAYAGTTTLEDARKWSLAHGKRLLFVNHGRRVKGACSVRPYSVKDFVWLISNADAVFTGSYHGLLYALYFERDVFYYGRGSERFASVAERLGIEGRCMDSGHHAAQYEMDWALVADRIVIWREESLSVLASYWPKLPNEGV